MTTDIERQAIIEGWTMSRITKSKDENGHPIWLLDGIPVYKYERIIYQPIDSINHVKLYKDRETKEVIYKREIENKDVFNETLLMYWNLDN